MHNPLIGEALINDARVTAAKALLIDAIKSHQSKITGVRPANPELKKTYEELLNKYGEYRGAKLYFPYIGSGIGNGCLVELRDGSVKYDFINGIGPHYFGHSHHAIINACLDAAISDTVMQGNLQQNKDAVEFSELLLKASQLDHCFLTTTGVMANENALKIAFQKKFPASRILAFERCFVGRTLAISQITDKPAFREGLPLNYHVDYVPFYDHLRPEESTKEALTILKRHIARYPGQHAVMCMELVQGEGGFHVGKHQFFKALIDILKEHQITVFVDEVQSFGRTPELFAFQYFGLQDDVDIVSVGKLSQACATLYRKEFAPRAGLLSQTFTGSTSALRAGKVIIESLLQGNYFGPEGKIQRMHDLFVSKFEQLQKQGLIEGPFGIGAMLAFTPFQGDGAKVTKFVHQLFEAGVMGFVAGANPTRVRFLIPIEGLTEEDVNQAMKIVETTLKNPL